MHGYCYRASGVPHFDRVYCTPEWAALCGKSAARVYNNPDADVVVSTVTVSKDTSHKIDWDEIITKDVAVPLAPVAPGLYGSRTKLFAVIGDGVVGLYGGEYQVLEPPCPCCDLGPCSCFRVSWRSDREHKYFACNLGCVHCLLCKVCG
jgi:hypothetical protein